MRITKQNFTEQAESVITKLKKENYGKLALTTSKIRNLLSLISELYSDASRYREDKLDEDMIGRVKYVKMRIAYEAGRETSVKKFVEASELIEIINEIKDGKQNLLIFCNYVEALVAYHKFHGGRDN